VRVSGPVGILCTLAAPALVTVIVAAVEQMRRRQPALATTPPAPGIRFADD
jgi:hypothetical protein